MLGKRIVDCISECRPVVFAATRLIRLWDEIVLVSETYQRRSLSYLYILRQRKLLGFNFSILVGYEKKEFGMIQLTTESKTGQLPRRTSAKFRGSVLLVDHDQNSIDSMSRWFEQEGCLTTPAFHPLYGLMMAAEQRIDAAVVDIDMFDMNGMEFLQELVRLKSFPIVVLTNRAEPGLARKVHELGASACFSKPANMNDVKTSIEQAIS